MATNSILLAVADPQMLSDIHQALGAGWEPISVNTESEALEQLEKGAFDALLVDFNVGSPDASELLNRALEKRPQTVRFLLAYEADLALVAAKVQGSHQILPKPIEPASLKSRIENGVKDSNSMQDAIEETSKAEQATAVPCVYSEVIKALDEPGITTDQIGEIIGRDAAVTAEVLRLSRSAYMGLPRNVSEPAKAVESLGLEAVRALVLALRFLAEHSHLKPGYLSVAQIWQHSTNVAQIARDLVLFETRNRVLASQALAAGLLHDLGKVVLVTNFDDLYGRVHSLARKQPVPLWEIEKEMFGANHGEIGACLVGMWNMSLPIVDATAFHHEPPLGESEQLTPLAAVHIANVLEHQVRPADEFRIAPIINTAFLNELGLLERLPVWRATCASRGQGGQQSPAESAETEQTDQISASTRTVTSRTANQLRGPAGGTQTRSSGQPGEEARKAVAASPVQQRGWIYTGLAAAVMFVLAFWLRSQPDLDNSAPVYARISAARPTPAQSQSTQPVDAAPPDETQAAPQKAISEPAPGTSSSSASELAGSQAEPQPNPTIASEESVTNASSVSLPAQKKPAEFRVTGIIYTVGRPSAIVNGKTVFVGDQVGGATVLSIGHTDVTLQINGQRKSYGLP
ncbi:MAG TPA: HDOD domain-containing protein [Patescibacteria group bacterium]|nr:HDOD domain-containing protein [Patescibacteria group bacterium]